MYTNSEKKNITKSVLNNRVSIVKTLEEAVNRPGYVDKVYNDGEFVGYGVFR